MSPPRILGRAQWRYFRHPGSERAVLSATDRGFHLSSRAHLLFPEGPTTLTYAVSCDRAWRPRRAQVDLRQQRQRHFRRIEIDADGSWTIDGFRDRELDGFTDVDLADLPSTNTLALKRLNLPVGGEAEIRTGWVVFPDLEVRAVAERYRRTSESHYRYEGLHNGLVAEFDVDDIGFVIQYPGYWERVPVTRPRGSARTGTQRPRSPRAGKSARRFG